MTHLPGDVQKIRWVGRSSWLSKFTSATAEKLGKVGGDTTNLRIPSSAWPIVVPKSELFQVPGDDLKNGRTS